MEPLAVIAARSSIRARVLMAAAGGRSGGQPAGQPGTGYRGGPY